MKSSKENHHVPTSESTIMNKSLPGALGIPEWMPPYRRRTYKVMKEEKFPELTGRMLKCIALLFMIVDHSAVVFVERGILQNQNSLFLSFALTDLGKRWQNIDFILRCAGRLAFPVFAFLLVEGFVHTRHKKRYGQRLFIFALLSEIPFDLAIFGKMVYPKYQNVMFTLLIAFLTLCAAERFWNHRLGRMIFLLIGCLAAEFLRADYGAMGVMFIVLLYLFRDSGIQLKVAAAMAVLESLSCCGAALLGVLLLRCYHGNEGKWPGKSLFYLAYPGHLLLLAWLYSVVFS